MKAYLEIEMPESCYYCRFMVGSWGYSPPHKAICVITGNDMPVDDRGVQHDPISCPLVPVPPHGDLIDRDVLKTAICSRLCIKSEEYLSPEEATIMNEIFAAPTIIPAEEGE